jgi:GGDEF domain-containing protein
VSRSSEYDPKALLRMADAAMYQAKNRLETRYLVYEERVRRSSEMKSAEENIGYRPTP